MHRYNHDKHSVYFGVWMKVNRVILIWAAWPAHWLWHTQVELPHNPYLSLPHLHWLCKKGMQILPAWLTRPTCMAFFFFLFILVKSNNSFSALASPLNVLYSDEVRTTVTFRAIVKGNDRRIMSLFGECTERASANRMHWVQITLHLLYRSLCIMLRKYIMT